MSTKKKTTRKKRITQKDTEGEPIDCLSVDALLDEKDEIKKLMKQHKNDENVCKALRSWRTKVNAKLKEKKK